MSCSPFGRADFNASAVLQAIRGEVPRHHGLRLASMAKSNRELIRAKTLNADSAEIEKGIIK
ncbi:MAG: hypothetical protein BBJ57_09530 [Desulfobacterales bacterium PC51MH44]|nr:MAG: hypothetical protein BBJ57_09530 [Desulfobacterales bacterium PC51MH44]